MKKRYLILLTLLLITLLLTVTGCKGGDSIEGMYVVTFDVNGGTMDIKTSSVGTPAVPCGSPSSE
jgi:hypothetical protein